MAFNIDIEEIEPQEDGLHDHSLMFDDIDDFLDDDDDCDDTDLFRFISILLNIQNYLNNPTVFEYSNIIQIVSEFWILFVFVFGKFWDSE